MGGVEPEFLRQLNHGAGVWQALGMRSSGSDGKTGAAAYIRRDCRQNGWAMSFNEFTSQLLDGASRLKNRLERDGWLKRGRDAWIWVREPLATIAVVLVSTTALAQPFYVPSGSMEPTIAIGDEIVAAKYAYGYGKYAPPFGAAKFMKDRMLAASPKVGDVVVFHPESDPGHAWVKRVIGLPGDHIQMLAGRLIINGKMLALKRDGSGNVEDGDGQYREVPRFIETLPDGKQHAIFKWETNGPLDNTVVFVVPQGHMFLMGDDRDNSYDSRVPAAEGGIGFVPMANLVGRAEFVLGSVDFLNAPTLLNWPGEFRIARLFKGVN
jgi:signal peptidase I